MDTQAASKADLLKETAAIQATAAESKAELKAEIAVLKADIELARRDLKIWACGLAGVVIASLSLIKFFGH